MDPIRSIYANSVMFLIPYRITQYQTMTAKQRPKIRWYGSWLAVLSLILACASCSHQANEAMDNEAIASIPLFFLSCADTPLLNAEIEGMTVTLKVDLGANCDLMLKDRVLEIIQDKEFKGMSQACDVSGNRYEDAQYLIPNMRIGNLYLQNAISGEENIYFLTKGSKIGRWRQKRIDQQMAQIDGRVGTGTLSTVHCYFDLPHKVLYLSETLAEIQKCYSPEKFIEVPFKLENGLIMISAETDFGTKKFMLDTGASASMLRKSQLPDARKDWIKGNLSLSEIDFGRWEFFLYDITEALPADGILGIDFFKKHAVHLDFEHKTANIQIEK